ncbi:MAG TPA: HAMP domain-containing histidine kinase [Candidatus Fraserbacteria bacterium]|nr:HAMP domain-containing histidine kinase [Candidatus Fraserbacteria bacterium]
MIGLRWKLWGLVLGTILVVLGGATLIGRHLMQIEIGRYVSAKHRQTAMSIAPVLADFYQSHDGWSGISGPEGVGPLPSRRQGKPFPKLPPNSLKLQFRPLILHQRLIVADSRGNVLADSMRTLVGQVLNAAELAKSAPITVGGQTVGYLLVGAKSSIEAGSLESLFRRRLTSILLLSGGLAGLLALLLGGAIAARWVGALRSMRAAAHKIASGEFSGRVAANRRDELGQLARELNTMAEQLQKAQRLRRQTVADIAHELRTPLAVIQGNLEAMAEGMIPLNTERIRSIHEEALLLTRLVEDLRTLSLAEAGELSLKLAPLPLDPWLRALLQSLQSGLKAKQLSLTTEIAPGLVGLADAQRLRQVLLNLLSNAIQHAPAGGQIELRVCSQGSQILLEVSDNGVGIPPEELPHLFDRFYRGRRSRLRPGSTGLGLAIAKALVEAHGGRIWAKSAAGQGTTFALSLPREVPH